ncbi:unnamed protein product, partial [Pylaiella littoralis]
QGLLLCVLEGQRHRHSMAEKGESVLSSHPFVSFGRRVLPALRIAGMVWERRTLAKISFGPDLTGVTFGPAVIEPLQGVVWTPGLKKLTLSSNWNLPPRVARNDKGG